MQKLRDLYKETQRFANENFDKITQDRMRKILNHANKQYEGMLNRNDFTNLDEVVFYRDKFQQIVTFMDESVEKGYKKPKVQAEFINILSQNYILTGQENIRLQMLAEEVINNSKIPKSGQGANPKEVIQSFFDTKKEEIQKFKIGFRSVIEDIPYVPKKYQVKASQIKKVGGAPPPNRQGEINALKDEIARLKSQLSDKDSQKQFRLGLLQIQKKEYEERIKELSRELEYIQSQNIVLKQSSSKSYQVGNFEPYQIETIHQQEQGEHQYNPYMIKFRQNDINKIKNKVKNHNFHQPAPSNRIYQIPTKNINDLIKQQSREYDKKSKGHLQIIHQLDSNQEQFKPRDSYFALNKSYKLNQSGVKLQAQKIALKSKICFFKSSMVIHKGDEFQIALKSVDLVRLQSKRVSIYLNNKSSNQQVIKLQYKFDPKYFEVVTKKKLTTVEVYNQGKQEVEVRLVNQVDLDSLIEVQMTINGNSINFLLPTMFIEFLEKRPEVDKETRYDVQKIVPLHQFSSLHSAEECLPLEKLYGMHEQSGRVYATSKYMQDYIYFKWLGGQVEIKTRSAWKLFIGYLLSRQY